MSNVRVAFLGPPPPSTLCPLPSHSMILFSSLIALAFSSRLMSTANWAKQTKILLQQQRAGREGRGRVGEGRVLQQQHHMIIRYIYIRVQQSVQSSYLQLQSKQNATLVNNFDRNPSERERGRETRLKEQVSLAYA